VGFEPEIPERERLQTHALNGAAFRISVLIHVYVKYFVVWDLKQCGLISS